MPLYRITHLKAPWPSGVRVGDVIELDAVPAWALGKCEPAAEGAEATVSFEQPAQDQGGADSSEGAGDSQPTPAPAPEGEPAAEGAAPAPKAKRKP